MSSILTARHGLKTYDYIVRHVLYISCLIHNLHVMPSNV